MPHLTPVREFVAEPVPAIASAAMQTSSYGGRENERCSPN